VDATLTFVQYFENIIYRVDLPGSEASSGGDSPYHSNRYLLRIHAMGDEQAIASELTWLTALNQEAGLPVPAPIKTIDGQILTKIVTPGIPQGRVVSMMCWLNGRNLKNGLKPQHLRALGRVVAQMHNFSADWQPPAGFSRPQWNWESQLGGSMFRHSFDDVIATIPAKFLQSFMVISNDAQQTMNEFGNSSDAYGLIHSDLYPENVLFKAGKAYPIDFEDCGFGYWMWDISIALCKWAWTSEWECMRDAFRDGYAEFRTLPEAQWSKLDLFIATQFATMVLWSSALLMNDPKRQAEYVPWREDNGNKLLGYFNR